jgi:uncharacterized protein YodC (DUF2158 family)
MTASKSSNGTDKQRRNNLTHQEGSTLLSTLSERLRTAQRNPSNRGGCVTCKWWDTISPETRALVNEWLDKDYSAKQLYEILSAPVSDESVDQPVPISMTGFRLHLNHHDAKCR